MILDILQYGGAALCVLAQVQRSCNPDWILISFFTSTFSAIVLTIYLTLTGQWGLLVVELVFITTNMIGIQKWRNKLCHKKTQTEN